MCVLWIGVHCLRQFKMLTQIHKFQIDTKRLTAANKKNIALGLGRHCRRSFEATPLCHMCQTFLLN